MSHEPSPPRPESRPDYLYSGGNVLMHPPPSLGHSEMYGLVVKGRREALHRPTGAIPLTRSAKRHENECRHCNL
jgi:hypothetical protein